MSRKFLKLVLFLIIFLFFNTSVVKAQFVGGCCYNDDQCNLSLPRTAWCTGPADINRCGEAAKGTCTTTPSTTATNSDGAPFNANCTNVASNTTTCSGSGIMCMVSTPVAGNISRYCCNTQTDCDSIKTSSNQTVAQKLASKAKPIPAPGKIPCDVTKNPEFNSDRPYQASPCGDAPKALFCGNSLQITEGYSKTLTNPKDFIAPGSTAPVNVFVNKTYSISLKDMQLPILGNTEEIKNSTNSNPQLDDATRMNEYLSAYLNGTTDQAEYGQTDLGTVIDFSGPVKKLLPQAIQEARRIATINATGVPTTSVPDASGSTQSEVSNHNQIVVCYDDIVPYVPSWLTWLTNATGLGKATPKECYKGSGAGAQDKFLRLKDWDDTPFEIALGQITSFLAKTVPGPILGQLVSSSAIADRWPKKIPPLPWEFTDPEKYTKAYNEWRGDLCAYVNLPILGKKLFCAGIPYITNSDYADLFPYVPLANTVDKSSKIPVPSGHAEIKPSGGTVIDSPSSTITEEPNIYFAHTQENADLSSFLNKTYVPLKGTDTNVPADSTEDNSTQCKVVDVRSNDGDNLFPEVKPDSYVFNAQFRFTAIPCGQIEKKEVCNDKGKKVDKIDAIDKSNCHIEQSQKCEGEATITLSTQTKTPYADQIWQTTTAGDSSTFRKIFPKVEANAPVNCIPDIPTVTNATYTLDSVVPQANDSGKTGTGPLSVEEPGGNKSDDSAAHVYFPHLGSVYDYFLKGIQTALRPKGYGEPVASGLLCSSINTSSTTGACKQWLFEKDSKGQAYYTKIIQAAGATSCKGKSLNPFWAVGIALNENGGLMTDDSKGFSKSHFGCNVSQFQSIEDKISCMTNTLRNDCLAGKTDAQTLSEYGYPPGYVMFPITVLAPGGTYPPPLFGSGFDTNQLVTNLLNANWVAVYGAKASIFCPSSPTLAAPKTK